MAQAAYKPKYQISKGGLDITNNFNDRATKIEIKIASGGGDSDTFAIDIDDRDYRLATPNTGETLAVYLGYEGIGMAHQGLFEINEIYLETPPANMRLVGLSAGMQSIMKSPVVENFTDGTTVGEIVSKVAGKAGLSVKIDPSLAGKEIKDLNQFQSNFHLLHELENRYDAVAKLEYGQIVFAKRDQGESISGLFLPMPIIQPQHVTKISAKITDRPYFSNVSAAWWDENEQKRVYENVDNQINNMASGDMPFIMNKWFKTQDEAKEAAKAKMAALNRARGEVTITLAKGNPWIRAQMPIIVGGFREGINGAYIIDTVTHTYIKDQGIMTTILAKPSGEDDQDAFTGRAGTDFFIPTPGQALGLGQFDPRAGQLNPVQRTLPAEAGGSAAPTTGFGSNITVQMPSSGIQSSATVPKTANEAANLDTPKVAPTNQDPTITFTPPNVTEVGPSTQAQIDIQKQVSSGQIKSVADLKKSIRASAFSIASAKTSDPVLREEYASSYVSSITNNIEGDVALAHGGSLTSTSQDAVLQEWIDSHKN